MQCHGMWCDTMSCKTHQISVPSKVSPVYHWLYPNHVFASSFSQIFQYTEHTQTLPERNWQKMLLDCNTHITQNSTLTHTTIAITKFLKKRYLIAPPLRLHHTQQRHSLSEEYNPFRKNSSSLGQKPKSSKTQNALTTIHFKKWSTSKLNCGQNKCWTIQ